MSLKLASKSMRRNSHASHVAFGGPAEPSEEAHEERPATAGLAAIGISETPPSPTKRSPSRIRMLGLEMGKLEHKEDSGNSNSMRSHGKESSLRSARRDSIGTHRSEAGNRTARMRSGSQTSRNGGATQRGATTARSNSRSGALTSRSKTRRKGKHPRLRWRGVLIAAYFLFKIRRQSGEKFLRHSHAKDWQECLAPRSAALVDLCRDSIRKPLEKRVHSDGVLVASWLQPVAVFATLPPAVVVDLSKTATHEAHGDGEFVYRAGDSAECAFVVLSGRVEMVASGAPGAQLAPGGAFGLVAVARSFPRLTSARCVGPVEVIRVERDEFQRRSLAEVERKARDDMAFLSALAPLRTWPRSRLVKLARVLRPRTFERGDVVIRQGDPVTDASLFIVLEGACSVQRASLGSRPRPRPADAKPTAPALEARELSRAERGGRHAGLTRRPPRGAQVTQRRVFEVALLGPAELFGDPAFLCDDRAAGGGAGGRRACSVVAASHGTKLLELTARNAAKLMDERAREALGSASYRRSLAILDRLRAMQKQAGERDGLRFAEEGIALRGPEAAWAGRGGGGGPAGALGGGLLHPRRRLPRCAPRPSSPRPPFPLVPGRPRAVAGSLFRNPTARASSPPTPPRPRPPPRPRLLPPRHPRRLPRPGRPGPRAPGGGRPAALGLPTHKSRKAPPPFLTSHKSRLPPPEPPPPGLRRSATLPCNIYGIEGYDPSDPEGRKPTTLSSSIANRNLSSFGAAAAAARRGAASPAPRGGPESDGSSSSSGSEGGQRGKLPHYMRPSKPTGLSKLAAKKLEEMRREVREQRRSRQKTDLALVRERLEGYSGEPSLLGSSPAEAEKRAQRVAADVFLEFRLKSGLDRPRTSSSFAPSHRSSLNSRGSSRLASSFGAGQGQLAGLPHSPQAASPSPPPPPPPPRAASPFALTDSGRGADGRPLTRLEARALASAASVEAFCFNNWERPYTALGSVAEDGPERRPWTSLGAAPPLGFAGLWGPSPASPGPARGARRPRPPRGPAASSRPGPGSGPGGYVVLREEDRPGYEGRPVRTPSGPLVKSVKRIVAPGSGARRGSHLYRPGPRAATAAPGIEPDARASALNAAARPQSTA
eukprot:tig00000802_g4289.t1